jgi:hypothetical protein
LGDGEDGAEVLAGSLVVLVQERVESLFEDVDDFDGDRGESGRLAERAESSR